MSCAETPGKPLNKYADQDEESVCGGCSLVDSKPENIDKALIPHVATAIGLSEIQKVGGTFQYPDGLTALEWECLKGLKSGNDKAESKRQARDRKKKR